MPRSAGCWWRRTLLLVPVLYAIFVLDLKIVRWETIGDGARHGGDHG